MEHGRTIHQGEAGHVGQVDLDQLGVQLNQLVVVGGQGDFSQDLVSLFVDVLAPVAAPVVLQANELAGQELVAAAPRHGGSSSVGGPHEDGVVGLGGVGEAGLHDVPLRILGLDGDADLVASGGNDLHGSLPVGPAVGADSVQGDLLAVVLTPAVAVGIQQTGLVQQLVGAVDVVAGPLQVSNGLMVVQSLLAVGGVHQGAGNIGEGGRLIGHGVGNDGLVVGGHGDGLPQSGVLSDHGDVHVVPCGGHGQADAVGGFIIVGGDGQIVFQPQVLDVADELLADIDLAGLQSQLAGGVVSEDNVGQILGNRQLAPHGLVCAPVVVVTDQNDLLVIGIILVVGAAPDDVFTGIVQDLGRIIVAAVAQGLDPGGLGNGSTADEVFDLQGVDGLAIFGQDGLDHEGLVAGGFDARDVSLVAGAGAVVGQHAHVPGGYHVSSGDGGAIGPVSGVLQGHGHLGQVVVPLVGVSQQAGLLAGQRVVHKQGLEHGGTVAAGTAGNGHSIVLVGANNIPAVDSAPLLACEVQGLFTGENDVAVGHTDNAGCRGAADCEQTADHSSDDQHRKELGDFLHDESSLYFC